MYYIVHVGQGIALLGVGTEKVNILYNLSDNIITFGGSKTVLENRVG
jgi:hypothetical protein